MRRRVRVRPSKPAMYLSLFVGIIFCILGFTVIIPQAGLFGVFWTLIAMGITAVNAYPLFSKKSGHTREILIDDEYDSADSSYRPKSDTEQRLQELRDLYNKGLITRDEYDKKREQILSEL